MKQAIIVEARQLTKRVASEPAELVILQDVNLKINAGEAVAIVGASGSGKSSLLALLAGLDVASAGDVLLAEQSLTELDEEGRAALRGQVASFIFQSFMLVPSLTALENVMLPLQLQGHPQAREAALGWLDKVGLGHRVSHFPTQLSGGEQQRVAIARAFIAKPQVLFADEPSANLDSKNGHIIENLLFSLNEQQGTTLVLVTHDSRLAERCDRVITLVDGQIQRNDDTANGNVEHVA